MKITVNQKTSKKLKQSGFTLVEIAIVLLIIAAIGVITAAGIKNTTSNTRIEKARAILNQINAAQVGAALQGDWTGAANLTAANDLVIQAKLQGRVPNTDADLTSPLGTIVYGSSMATKWTNNQPGAPYILQSSGQYIFPNPSQTAP